MANAEVLLNRAQMLLVQKRPRDAERSLREALGQDPENHHALALLARCKYELRQPQEGVEVIQQALRLQPHEDYYHYLLGFGYYQQNKNAAAQGQLRKAISLNPYAADYFGLLALIQIDERDFETALENADEGLAVHAGNITCLNARSTALNKLKRIDDAIDTMETALKQDPENDFTHNTVAWNLLEKGRHREAARHFREALRLNAAMENARMGLKEALKSRIAPYRWLLQYSFWINNKGKNARWMIPIAIFLAVRLASGAFEVAGKEGSPWSYVAVIILVLYLLLVATTWIISPLANFLLLFHSDGKYALTQKEKWNALLFIAAVASGLAIVISGACMPVSRAHFANLLFIGGCITMSLALPLGHMQFPWRLRNNHFAQWLAMVLVPVGIITVITTLSGQPVASVLSVIYLPVFIIYMWVSAFSR